MRARIMNDVKSAMKAKDKTRLGTLRLIQAAIQSAEIEARGDLDDTAIMAVMTKMVKQRRDSIKQYTDGGRPELAAVEEAEIAIIEAYLPQQMSDDETAGAVSVAIAEAQATTAKDMGKVMAILKKNHAGVMDFQKASGLVKAALS